MVTFTETEALFCLQEAVKRLGEQLSRMADENGVITLDDDQPVLRYAFGTSRENLIADVKISKVVV